MDRRLLEEMRGLVEAHPRYGSERVHQLLVGTGWRVNFKRVHRLWRQEHLQVPQKQRKRRRLPGSSAGGIVRHRAKRPNHVWSYDFLADRTEDGRQLKLLAVIDEYTRECLAIETGR
ncbi:MAG: IS3 family transposase, partial [Candidatus Brocadiia bacterium]|nr:IS3 family transposase [Candidatus Brocadiia bacterium]